MDRLQFVTFVDGGYVKMDNPLGEQGSFTLVSAGVGFRLSLTSHAQMRFDWGFPLAGREDVVTPNEEIKSTGRFHLSAQVQF